MNLIAAICMYMYVNISPTVQNIFECIPYLPQTKIVNFRIISTYLHLEYMYSI